MATLVICNDLFFQTKIETTAALLGKPIKIVPDKETLAPALKENPTLIIWDLNAGFNLVETAKLIKENSKARIVAYVSHVQTDLIKKAKEVGIDEIMPRSAFTIKLPQILQ
ncbi:response regulator transcription factor [Candidatus Woesearchaeota archaeon]|nr:response regulator transcription factor [Candidatus Woesearchaeota archaeon]